jgi:hypothetical protein
VILYYIYVQSFSLSVMLEFLFGHFGHQVSTFAKADHLLVRAMGMDTPVDGAGQSGTPVATPTETVTKGPIEYVFKIETAPAGKNAEGILTSSGAPNSAPLIRFIGSAGKSELVPIKLGMQSGKLYEFSAIAKDVGPVKSIELSDPHGTGTWTPAAVSVNRIPSLPDGHKQAISKPDGWVAFKIGKQVGIPKVFEPTNTPASSGAASNGGPATTEA